jgi:hypothetical protein
MVLTIKSSEAERNFSKLSVIKNKFQSTMLVERLNYLSVFSAENGIKSSYEEAKSMQPKNVGKKGFIEGLSHN